MNYIDRHIFALLIFSLLFSFQACEKKTSTDFIGKYFEPSSNPYPSGDPEFAASNIRQQAVRLYQQKNYEQAIVLFDVILPNSLDDKERMMWLFYKANAQLATQQVDNAQQTLEYIDENSSLFNDRQWLMALIYAQKGSRKKANALLSGLTNDPKLGDKARRVLEENW